MTVPVLLFARYRELAGVSSIEVEVGEHATLAEVWAEVRSAIPALGPEARPLFSCDRRYARLDQVLQGTEEIAVFPPVSGG